MRREQFNDLAQLNLHKLIKTGNITVASQILKTQNEMAIVKRRFFFLSSKKAVYLFIALKSV